ncbi:MAG: putative tripartite tricarboxylate transporter TctB protein [Candidatus Micrarchaeota archaeon]|nr:MAG: putative tripartite tricarboxylate transporter TctB protein [Candidatus Micrarchaeota archaeon]
MLIYILISIFIILIAILIKAAVDETRRSRSEDLLIVYALSLFISTIIYLRYYNSGAIYYLIYSSYILIIDILALLLFYYYSNRSKHSSAYFLATSVVLLIIFIYIRYSGLYIGLASIVYILLNEHKNKNRDSREKEIKRDLIQIIGVIPAAIAYIFAYSYLYYILAILSFIGLIAVYSASIYRIKPLLALERDVRIFGVGAIYLFASILLIDSIFNSNAVAYAIFILFISDSLATIVGISVGRRKLPYNKRKSIEGSLAFLISAFIISLAFMNLYYSLIASLVLAFIESINIKVDDNLLIPIAAAILLTII